MSNLSVLSLHERLIIYVGVIIVHIIIGILMMYWTAYETPYPPRKPAGITLVSLGKPVQVSSTPVDELQKKVVKDTPPKKEKTQKKEMPVKEEANTETKKIQKKEPSEKILTNQNDNEVQAKQKDAEKENPLEKPKLEKPIEKIENKALESEKKKDKKAMEEKPSTPVNNSVQTPTDELQGNSKDADMIGKVGEENGITNDIPGWELIGFDKPDDYTPQNGKIVLMVTLDGQGNIISVNLESTTVARSVTGKFIEALEKRSSFRRKENYQTTTSSKGRISFELKI